MREDIRQFLPTLTIFRGLADHEIDRVCSLINIREFAANEIIAHQGDLATTMFIIGIGRCQVTLTPENQDERIVLAELTAGDCIGEMALVDIQPRSASITAVESSTLLELSNMDFLTIYDWNVSTYALMLNNLCREISRRLRKANQRIATLSGSSIDESSVS